MAHYRNEIPPWVAPDPFGREPPPKKRPPTRHWRRSLVAISRPSYSLTRRPACPSLPTDRLSTAACSTRRRRRREPPRARTRGGRAVDRGKMADSVQRQPQPYAFKHISKNTGWAGLSPIPPACSTGRETPSRRIAPDRQAADRGSVRTASAAPPRRSGPWTPRPRRRNAARHQRRSRR